MKYRKLGRSGLEVSEIGFGAWGIGGTRDGAVSYGPADDRESVVALRRSFDLGVTFYDTADLYGAGHSERLIGSALHDVRQSIVIGTKVGFLGPYGPQDFSPPHLRASLEASLRRLNTDYIDLYQLHNAPVDQLLRETHILDTLDRFVAEGKVGALGISLRSPEDGLAAVKELRFKAIQVNFNMIDQRAMELGLFALCGADGVGVICRTPLCYGFLSGKYEARSRFGEGDHRAGWSAEQIDLWAEAHRHFRGVTGEEAEIPADVALRFCLSYPAVSTVIPGMLTREQVEENVLASERGCLPVGVRSAIEEIYRQHTFFLPRGKPGSAE